MELNKNQAVLILETSEDGEITVDIRTGNDESVATAICEAIGQKLLTEEKFQQEIFSMIYEEE